MNIVDVIRSFNAGRDPERLAMQYETLGASPSLFLRGTCHLCYDRLPRDKVLAGSPVAWICGNLHFENFGTYRGVDRLVYFDVTDFDEPVLAPVGWEPVRLLASGLVAREALRIKRKDAARLCDAMLESYAQALVTGKASRVDRDNADGPVQELLTSLKDRKRREFLAGRTRRKGRSRFIRCDGEHALATSRNGTSPGWSTATLRPSIDRDSSRCSTSPGASPGREVLAPNAMWCWWRETDPRTGTTGLTSSWHRAAAAARNKWQDDLVQVAHPCAGRVAEDWRTYCNAHGKGPL